MTGKSEVPKDAFLPSLEAHPTDWESLLQPVRRAVGDLLFRIDGAIAAVQPQSGIETTNCFLVQGERGTGKSTVLLSAARAFSDPEIFFGTPKSQNDGAAGCSDSKDAPGAQLRDYYETVVNRLLSHHTIIWMEPLDLEPLPPEPNLLVVLLTQLINSIDQPDSAQLPDLAICHDQLQKGARQSFIGLIHDAALTWRKIEEADSRSRANREIRAAEIYATFRKSFRSAMKALCSELARKKGGPGCAHIVLPIDHIDRNPESLASIVKLARLVAAPGLWLVLAGDHQDIETFLERAYWQELIKVGNAVGPRKPGLGGEDEAFVMARRQAAAAFHKLLPESHRIQVEPLSPEETLAYRRVDAKGESKETLEDLLGQIRAEQDWDGPPELTLISFLRKSSEHKSSEAPRPEEPRSEKPPLTEAASLGLRLPARVVSDLWSVVHGIATESARQADKNGPPGREPPIQRIAMTMLEDLLAESAITNELMRVLRHDVIVRSHCGPVGVPKGYDVEIGGTNPTLVVEHVFSPKVQYSWFNPLPAQELKYQERSLFVRATASVVRPSKQRLRMPRHKESRAPDDLLPDRVAAWFSILHDGVLWSKSSGLLGSQTKKPHLVHVEHRDAARQEDDGGHSTRGAAEVWWPAPEWKHFLAHDRFQSNWMSLLGEEEDWLENKDTTLRLLAIVWVFCAIDTFVELYAWERKDWKEYADADSRKQLGEDIRDWARSPHSAPITFESKVWKLADKVRAELKNSPKEIRYSQFMIEWLDFKLPLFFSHLYVPVGEKTMEWVPGRLIKVWEERKFFIIGELERELAPLFCTPSKRERREGRTCLKTGDIPEPFNNLHRLFNMV